MLKHFSLYSILIIFTIPSLAHCQTIRFDDVLEKAVRWARDIEIARIDEKISEYNLIESRAMYLPKIDIALYNEYNKDLDSESQDVSYVGDSVVSSNDDGYSHAMIFSLSYNLYDFGIRGLKYKNLKKSVEISQFKIDQMESDIKIEVLQLYGKGLSLYKNVDRTRATLQLKESIYDLTRRLVTAGGLGQLDLAEAAIEVAELLRKIDQYQASLQDVLAEISFYTGDEYDPDKVGFASFDEADLNVVKVTDLHLTAFPEVVALDREIEKKEAELSIVKRQRLPSISLFSNYKLFSDHPNHFFASMNRLKEKSVDVGFVINFTFFEGFSSVSRANRVRQEIKRLQTSRRKLIAEKKMEVDALAYRANLFAEKQILQAEYLTEIERKLAMAEKLGKEKIIDTIFLLNQQADFQQNQLEVELESIERTTAGLKLQFLSESLIK